MTDLYGLGMSGLPPEHQAKYRAMQQQQMMAQAMLAQSQDPLANQAPGVAVSPFQGLAKIAQAYIGAKGMRDANKGYQAIGEQYTNDQNAAIAKVQAAMAPAPAQNPVPLANADGVHGEMVEKSLEQKQAVVRDALMNQFPNVRSYASTMNSDLQQEKQAAALKAHQIELLNDKQKDREAASLRAIEETKRQEAERERVRLEQHQRDLETKRLVASGQGQSPYFTPVQTADGVFAFNARTGRAEPVAVNGKQVVGAQYDPNLQGRIAEGKESGKVTGKATAEAKMDLPMAISKAELGLKQVDDMLSHPGLNSYVGATLKPGASLVDGTPEADFRKRLEQIQGTAFLQAFEGLKGGGQITEVEGKKATEAITRMNKSQSEKEFKAAAEEFKGYIKTGLEKAKQKSGQIPSKLSVKGPSSVDALLEKYK